ncbi:MAG TPA: DUF255 domain-containing protein [Longimicrobiales bacterium]|nr:DUF255 domain-containing protein [Longimicrobiales bacterium]
MGQSFRFSPSPNRASEINWLSWGQEAFAEAGRSDKPILLCLTSVWCQWCSQMDATTYSDPVRIAFINQHFIPIRVDADRYPHVQEQYIATGWPTNAFLTPTGEVLWSGTYIPPDQFDAVAEGVRSAWADRRAELGAEIERRRKALDAARGRIAAVGIVRREAADDVWTSILESYDPRNGGFGTAPKYPAPEAVELLFIRAAEDPERANRMAAHTLDGMIAGELWDSVGHGFFRYALEADWTEPQSEKLLPVNAALLRAYALGAHLLGRADWRTTAERIVEFADRTFRLDNGLWASSQAAAPEYSRASAAERATLEAPPVDATVYTSTNAQWMRALADAGARLGKSEWIATAERGLERLLDEMAAPNGLLYHYCEPGSDPQLPYLLIDVAEAARACVSLAQAAGNRRYLERAQQLVSAIEQSFWADAGGFYDRIRTDHDVGVLRYRDRPFDINADVSRLLIDLTLATGQRNYRALAERTLALLSPLAGRFGVGGANFAIAVQEFYEAPVQVFVVGAGARVAELRRAALALPTASLRVWPLPQGGRVGTQTLPLRAEPAAYVVGTHGAAAPVTDPAALAAAVADVG